jgi:hypothetical protein
MKMISVLRNIFLSLDFNCEEFDFEGWSAILLTPDTKNQQKSFFIVIDNEKADEACLTELLNGGALRLKDNIRTRPSFESSFDKNTFLVICYSGSKPRSKVIWQLEEDPYVFKKCILKYSPLAVDSLLELLDDDFSIANLNRNIMNIEHFEGLKTRANINFGYELLTYLFMKIPVIIFSREINIAMSDLPVVINKALTRDKLVGLRDNIMLIGEVDGLDAEGIESFIQRNNEDQLQ